MIVNEIIRYFLALLCNRKLNSKSFFRIRTGCHLIAKSGCLNIGKGFSMLYNTHITSIEHGFVTIEDNVFFNRNCIVVCREKISIGEGTVFGPNVCIYDHDHYFDIEGVHSNFKTGEIIIGNNCWIGAGAIILKNTFIGDGCVIGAGCIVKGEIPSHSIVTSNRELLIKPIIKKGKEEYE